jgi:hypothetical protein
MSERSHPIVTGASGAIGPEAATLAVPHGRNKASKRQQSLIWHAAVVAAGSG